MSRMCIRRHWVLNGMPVGTIFVSQLGVLPNFEVLIKRRLVSDVAKIFDILGWFSTSVVLMGYKEHGRGR